MEFSLTQLILTPLPWNATEHLCNGIQFNSTQLNTFVMELNLTPLQWNSVQHGIQFNSTQLNTFVMEFSSTQRN
jgi:hypothetical protein